MDKARSEGKACCIGVTGYPLDMQRKLIEQSSVRIDTSLCYCHYSLNDRTLLDFLPFFKERNIAIINAGALGMGLLSNGGPPVWHPATEEIRNACSEAVNYCQARGLDIAKLGMHFAIHSEASLATCLVSSNVHEFMMSNIATATSVSLSAEEEAAIAHMKDGIFAHLESCTWEGVEVAKYWSKVKAKRLS
eukprot:1748916-Amphidinium_carterae.1